MSHTVEWSRAVEGLCQSHWRSDAVSFETSFNRLLVMATEPAGKDLRNLLSRLPPGTRVDWGGRSNFGSTGPVSKLEFLYVESDVVGPQTHMVGAPTQAALYGRSGGYGGTGGMMSDRRSMAGSTMTARRTMSARPGGLNTEAVYAAMDTAPGATGAPATPVAPVAPVAATGYVSSASYFIRYHPMFALLLLVCLLIVGEWGYTQYRSRQSV
jgi:hypothetical protein